MYSQQKLDLKNTLNHNLSQAKIILNEYDLCDYCIGRLFSKKSKLSSNVLGRKLKKSLHFKSKKNCYICKNLLSNQDLVINNILEKTANYQFSTFVIGAILRPSMSDRDDVIRSKFRLKGIDSIKTSITHQLAKKFAKKTKTKINHLNPDLTITYNFKNDSCELQSRSLFFSGRYVKKIRGTPQKEISCKNCNGKGCLSCNHHGISTFSSVEGKISKFLFEKFGGTQLKINWIGGEDKNSLVLGNGRPFFAKLLQPKKRKSKLHKKYSKEKIEIHNLKIISKLPSGNLPFKSTIDILVLTQDELKSNVLDSLKSLKDATILIRETSKKQIKKNIYQIKFQKKSLKSFHIRMIADGGLPIKRFVEGNNLSPNLSEILDNRCKCEQFDFSKIELTKI